MSYFRLLFHQVRLERDKLRTTEVTREIRICTACVGNAGSCTATSASGHDCDLRIVTYETFTVVSKCVNLDELALRT
jgi:hypothetical protein